MYYKVGIIFGMVDVRRTVPEENDEEGYPLMMMQSKNGKALSKPTSTVKKQTHIVTFLTG